VVTNPLARWLIDQAMSWLLDDFRRALAFGAVMVVGALVAMFWLGRVTLRPPIAELDELPQALDEALEEPAEPDNHRGIHRRGKQRQHRYPLHEREDDVEHRPSSRPALYGRPLSPIARALRHPAVQLPVVGVDETTAFLVRAVDGTLVYQRKRDVQPAEVLADGEVHRG
jgi:hypothetical protein